MFQLFRALDRFNSDVEDHNLDVNGQVRWGPNVLQNVSLESRSRPADSHFHISVSLPPPPLPPPSPSPHLLVCQVKLITSIASSSRVMWLCWLRRCSQGPCSYPCRSSHQVGLNYPKPLLAIGEEIQIICKVQVIKLGPGSPQNFIPLWAVNVFNTQLMASRNRKGDGRHPCLTPVFTWNASVSWSPLTTLQVIPL